MPSTPILTAQFVRRLTIPLALVLVVALSLSVRLAAASDQVLVEGRIAGIASSITAAAGGPVSAPSVSLLLAVEGSPVTVELIPDVQVLDARGATLPVSTLDLKAQVRAFGVWQSATVFLAHRIEVLPQKS